MDQKKFEGLLILIVPQIVGLIVQNCDLDEVAATMLFYKSRVYALLEQEETKLWHYSPLTLFNMYNEERDTGNITFPEGWLWADKAIFRFTELYKSAKKLTGKQVSEFFSRYGVWDYIYSCFEALHTTGANYIVEDIDLYIEARQPTTGD